MDGIHDLGGKQGFGPVDATESGPVFKAPWEGRMWAISRTTDHPGWTLDWWRHIRELIEPADYLTRPYLDQWAQTQLAGFIDSGVVSLEEAIAGRSATPPVAPPPPITRDQALAGMAGQETSYARDCAGPPVFAVGQEVRCHADAPGGHTRLPAYVRGRRGTIHAVHGGFVFADASARGLNEAQHLYSVVFEAGALWPEATGRADRIFLDLWESYLEPA